MELRQDKVLKNQLDNASNGNVVQCGEVGDIGADTTFTVALGYGSDVASAVAAANGSLSAGLTDREAAYRGISPYGGGWNGYRPAGPHEREVDGHPYARFQLVRSVH